MRAVCESCNQPQPADWRPGDLCVHCGLPARQQIRCYWCAHWIPTGNFCRHCGAEGIAPDQYAPARMIKFYGADMFSIPKMLRDMDPARIDTFRSIYGQHLAVALRHVEELRNLEKELFVACWSGPLEEELIPQLPWREDEFARYAGPGRGVQSPVLIIQTLASLVALRQSDFSLLQSVGGSMLSAGMRPDLQLEAALQISNWRVAGNTYLEELRYPAMDCLRRAEPQTLLVQLSRAYLGDQEVDASTLQESLTSDNPEVAFFGALLLDNEPSLIRALDSANPLQRSVAANKLIRIGRAAPVAGLFARSANVDQQQEMLGSILQAKKPVHEWHPALFELIERNPRTRLSRLAANAICLGCSPDEAMRLAESLDWDILHALSLSKCIQPETFRAIGELLVRENKVDMHQYAWGCLATPDRMPQDFVELIFSRADTSETEKQLLQFAEKQLDQLYGQPKGTPMERVLIQAAFGDHAPEVIGTAWSAMRRINYHREYGSPSPFPYSMDNILQFWPYPEFEQRVERLQGNELAMQEIFVAEELRRFLGSKRGEA